MYRVIENSVDILKPYIIELFTVKWCYLHRIYPEILEIFTFNVKNNSIKYIIYIFDQNVAQKFHLNTILCVK